MQSREVVQTSNRTSLSDRAAYNRVLDFGNPTKNSRQNAKRSCPCAPKMPCVTPKNIILVLCYLKSGMGPISIPTEDLSPTQIIIDILRI